MCHGISATNNICIYTTATRLHAHIQCCFDSVVTTIAGNFPIHIIASSSRLISRPSEPGGWGIISPECLASFPVASARSYKARPTPLRTVVRKEITNRLRRRRTGSSLARPGASPRDCCRIWNYLGATTLCFFSSVATSCCSMLANVVTSAADCPPEVRIQDVHVSQTDKPTSRYEALTGGITFSSCTGPDGGDVVGDCVAHSGGPTRRPSGQTIGILLPGAVTVVALELCCSSADVLASRCVPRFCCACLGVWVLLPAVNSAAPLVASCGGS